MDKVREVFELEEHGDGTSRFCCLRRTFKLLNTRSDPPKYGSMCKTITSGYSIALLTHMMNDVDSMKHILENGLITDRNIVQMDLRYLDTTEGEERKSPESTTPAMLEWLRVEIAQVVRNEKSSTSHGLVPSHYKTNP